LRAVLRAVRQRAGAFDGQAVDGQAVAQGYSIDSRTVQPGEVFFAVKGERLDGHDFVEQALGRGAIAAVVEKARLERYSNLAGCLRSRTRWWRCNAGNGGAKDVGKDGHRRYRIDGQDDYERSDGAFAGDPVSRASHQRKFQQSFWLPLGLLTLEPEYDVAVVEMGMSHAGEIAALARIALPNDGVVTNVAPVHLESFDSIAGIARAKYELIEALPHGGVAVLNADDEYVCQFGRDFKGRWSRLD